MCRPKVAPTWIATADQNASSPLLIFIPRVKTAAKLVVERMTPDIHVYLQYYIDTDQTNCSLDFGEQELIRVGKECESCKCEHRVAN